MISKRIVLTFPHKLVDQPTVYKLVKEFDLVFNILQAKITPQEQGVMVIELTGKKDNFARGVDYLKEVGIDIQPLTKEVIRDEEKCVHCGACVTICPADALSVEHKTMKISFDNKKCIACELCVRACPPRAMIVKL